MYAHDTAAVLLADKEKEKARKTKRNAEHKGFRTKEAEVRRHLLERTGAANESNKTDDNDDTKGVKEYENIEAFLDQQDTDIKKWKDRWD